MTDTAKEFLAHYGVPGMKWGVRKTRPPRTVRARVGDSDDYIVSRNNKRRKVRTLSNQEIKKTNERLQLEKQLAQLKRDQAAITKGHNFIKSTLAFGATGAAIYTFAQSPFGKASIKKAKTYLDNWR